MTDTYSPKAKKLHGELSKLTDDELRDYWALVNLRQTEPSPPEPEQAEPSPERFKVYTSADVWADSEPIEYLVDGLITAGGLFMIVGEGGSKKTWLALDLAVCVSIGTPWLDFDLKQTPVLIVDEDSGKRRLTRRLREVYKGHLLTPKDQPPISYISLEGVDFGDPDCVNALQVLILKTGAGLVIVDILANVAPGRDENSVKDMQPVLHNMRALAETTGATIGIIHHNNKQNGYRGSTSIKGALDLMLSVESATESPYINVSVDKARDLVTRMKFAARVNSQPEIEQFYLTTTDTLTKTKAATNKTQRYILRYIIEHTQAEMNEIMGDPTAPCAPGTVKRTLYDMLNAGYVERTDPGGTGRGVKAIFQLTDKGKELASRELAEGEE